MKSVVDGMSVRENDEGVDGRVEVETCLIDAFGTTTREERAGGASKPTTTSLETHRDFSVFHESLLSDLGPFTTPSTFRASRGGQSSFISLGLGRFYWRIAIWPARVSTRAVT